MDCPALKTYSTLFTIVNNDVIVVPRANANVEQLEYRNSKSSNKNTVFLSKCFKKLEKYYLILKPLPVWIIKLFPFPLKKVVLCHIELVFMNCSKKYFWDLTLLMSLILCKTSDFKAQKVTLEGKKRQIWFNQKVHNFEVGESFRKWDFLD